MRKRQLADTRPRWNDEDLTVRYNGRDYSAEEYRQLCERCLPIDLSPNWRDDPSYDWKAKCKQSRSR